MNKNVILMILDGWGLSPNPKISAIDNAKTPFIDILYNKYPHATLRTDGLHVGLPEGQMGNSEVGHINLGAGRIVYQDLVKINRAVEHNTLKDEKALKEAFTYAKTHHKAVHFLGLVSDGGVHSHSNHLKGLITAAEAFGLRNCYVHAFTDGRDVAPKSGKHHIHDLETFLNTKHTQIASVTGRYYAMDRDKRWERIQIAYNAIVKGEGETSTNLIDSIQKSYDNGITDEFLKPIIKIDNKNSPVSKLQDNDVVIFFNFRTDRGRQLTDVLSQNDYPEFGMSKLLLHYVTMTNYDETFNHINVIFNKHNLNETLGEVLEKHNKTQLRIAETEKYPHVTFFFSGGRETPFKGEERILKNSPKVATYDLQPEMSAYELAKALTTKLENTEVNFVCLNFANGDMVGHTGNMDATVKACEAVDACVNKVVTTALKNKYTTILIADHGNCDTMLNPDGSPHTAHTTNPVPVILIDNDIKTIENGILANIAPTILKLMGIPQPEVMTENALI